VVTGFSEGVIGSIGWKVQMLVKINIEPIRLWVGACNFQLEA
jgi:hypothetical protein